MFFCHKIIWKKHFIVKNFDRGYECILPMNILFFNIVLNTFLALISFIPHRACLSIPWNLLGPGISILNLFSLWGIPLISWLSEGFEKGSLRRDPRPMPTTYDCGCKMGEEGERSWDGARMIPSTDSASSNRHFSFCQVYQCPSCSHKIDTLISFREPALT